MRGRFVARTDELARMLDLAEDGGRVVLVRGEAGIGKTALVEHFIEVLEDRADVLLGASDDLLTPQPLGPVRDMARRRSEIADALSTGDRAGVMDLLFDLLARPWQPTVIVLEDTQWADDATLDLITYLGRRIESTQGLLLLTYRDSLIDHAHPLRRVIGDLPGTAVEHVRLGGLSAEAVHELADGRDVDATQILRLTGGNALFVTELLASGPESVPVSVRDAVLSRVARLTAPAWDTVQFAAIVPGGLSWPLLDRLGGGGVGVVGDAVRHGLLDVDADGVRFRHELQRRAVEDSLAPPETRRRHGLVLAALGEDADAARLAHHAAGAGDAEALVRHAHRAAREAAAASSHREALAHYRSLGPYIDRLADDVAADVMDGWARAATYQGDPDAVELARRAVELRRRVGDALALQRALSFGVFVVARGGLTDLAVSWAEEAVTIAEELGAAAELARAHAELARLHLAHGEMAAGHRAARRAIELGEELGDDRIVASGMVREGMFRAREGDATAVELIVEAARLAREAGYPFEEADAHLLGAVARGYRHDDPDVILGDLAVAVTVATASHQDGLAAFSRGISAETHVWTGDWTVAEQEATAILTSTAPHDAVVLASRVVAVLAVRRGRPDVEDTLHQLWADATRLDHPFGHQAAMATTAEYLWTSGSEAGEWLALLDGVEDVLGGTDLFLRDELVHWLQRLGLLDPPPTFLSGGFRALAEGRPEQAAAFWEERGMPYHRAIALTTGEADDVVSGVHLLDSLGADATAHRVRAELRARGDAVPRPRSRASRQNAAGLTARQMEVLGLLDEECTNAEIADTLFISQRTAEHHVAAVLRAMDVADRRAAVDAARDLGVLPEE